MNIQLLYAASTTGRQLVERLEQTDINVQTSETTFIGLEYLQIDLRTHPGPTRMFNNGPAVKLAMNQKQAFDVLQANRVLCLDTEEDNINRVYKILVCDLEILSVCVEIKGKGAKPKYIKENENMKAAQLARKVSILLGLDMVMVEVVLTNRRKWKIAGLETSPELRSKDVDRVVKKLQAICLMNHKEVKLGADPEFMLVNRKSGRMVAASDYFPRDGIVGCDAIRIPNRQQRPIAEIRPRPNSEPQHLVLNIREALGYANRMVASANVKWVAGSQPFPGYSIGGHIHFSNIKLNAAILRALDNYLGIPVFMIENQATAVKRRKRYGKLSDYRNKSHGGFEYRTPGSWLVSREIATAVLCLAKVVISHYPELNHNYLNNPQAQQAFYRGDQDHFRKVFPMIWAEIEATDLGRKYIEEISILKWMVDNQASWDEKRDLRKTWKLGGKTKKKSGRFTDAELVEASFDDTQFESDFSDVALLESDVIPTHNRPRRRQASSLMARTRSPRNARVSRSIVIPGTDSQNLFYPDLETDNPDLARVIGPEHIRRVSTHFEVVSAYPGATVGY